VSDAASRCNSSRNLVIYRLMLRYDVLLKETYNMWCCVTMCHSNEPHHLLSDAAFRSITRRNPIIEKHWKSSPDRYIRSYTFFSCCWCQFIRRKLILKLIRIFFLGPGDQCQERAHMEEFTPYGRTLSWYQEKTHINCILTTLFNVSTSDSDAKHSSSRTKNFWPICQDAGKMNHWVA